MYIYDISRFQEHFDRWIVDPIILCIYYVNFNFRTREDESIYIRSILLFPKNECRMKENNIQITLVSLDLALRKIGIRGVGSSKPRSTPGANINGANWSIPDWCDRFRSAGKGIRWTRRVIVDIRASKINAAWRNVRWIPPSSSCNLRHARHLGCD